MEKIVESHAHHVEKRGSDSSSLEDATQTATSTFVHDSKRSAHLRRRFDRRILPICAFIYLLNYLDRANIGNAKVLNTETGDNLLQRTGMSTTDYAITISMFSVAYWFFEVPSNIIMKRYVRPSWWLGFLLFGWGALTLGFAGVKNFPTVVTLRFFIGVFEAGFFPGIVYYITFWYRMEERAIRIAIVLASATAAGAFGGCIAYGVGFINRAAGLEGFRWLSIIEGTISVAAVLLCIFFLPDLPSKAKWLSDDDKKYAEDRLNEQGAGYHSRSATKHEWTQTMFAPRMLLHYFAYICNCVPLGSLNFFSPTIVNGLGYNSVQAQLMTVPPWAVGYVICLVLSYSADRFNARGWHIAGSSILGGLGWLIAGALPPTAYAARYGCLFLCACGAFPSAGPMTAWVTCNVPAIVCMGIATAMNNSGAGIGQVLSQWIWRAQEASQGYPTGNFVCAACSFVVAAIAVYLRFHYARMIKNGTLDASGSTRQWML